MNGPRTWRRGDRIAEVFTNVDGDSMAFIPWNDSKVLLHNEHELSLEAAERLVEVTNSRATLNMAHWTLCFALDPDEEAEYFPCGSSVEDYMSSRNS
jgi:hypothetical protein